MTTTPTAIVPTQANLKAMSISQIALVIKKHWAKVYFGAVPYVDAMRSMDKITDPYGADDGKSIVLYFLSNAGTWRGEAAKLVKAELNARLKNK